MKARDALAHRIVVLRQVSPATPSQVAAAFRQTAVLARLEEAGRNFTGPREVLVQGVLPEMAQLDALLGHTSQEAVALTTVHDYAAHDLLGLLRRRVRLALPQLKCLVKQLLAGLNLMNVSGLGEPAVTGSRSPHPAQSIYLNREGRVQLDPTAPSSRQREPVGQFPPVFRAGLIFMELLLSEAVFSGQPAPRQAKMLIKVFGAGLLPTRDSPLGRKTPKVCLLDFLFRHLPK